MRVLVTGGAGYIGSALVEALLEGGRQVTVLDALAAADTALPDLYQEPAVAYVQGDIRSPEAVAQSLAGARAVVHLAATVMVTGSESEEEARLIDEVNFRATCAFVDACRQQGVERFVFTSTCGNYGMSDPSRAVTEDDPLDPTSPYSQAKVRAEEYVLGMTGPAFYPTVLRLAAVFGAAPRVKFASLLNQLVREAVIEKRLVVFGPQSWRPVVHVADVARAIGLALSAPPEAVSGQVFNVGGNALNYRKQDLALLIGKHLPGTTIEINEGKSDPRSYRVSFDKIARVLGFEPLRDAEQGIVELRELLTQNAGLRK